MNTTHIKIESDALVCMICVAAFIGYALGIQKVMNVIKSILFYNITSYSLAQLFQLNSTYTQVCVYCRNSN